MWPSDEHNSCIFINSNSIPFPIWCINLFVTKKKLDSFENIFILFVRLHWLLSSNFYQSFVHIWGFSYVSCHFDGCFLLYCSGGQPFLLGGTPRDVCGSRTAHSIRLEIFWNFFTEHRLAITALLDGHPIYMTKMFKFKNFFWENLKFSFFNPENL